MSKTPQVLLVGAGQFGRHHLDHWLDLHRQGHVRLVGVVVASRASQQRLQAALSDARVPAHQGLTSALMHGVDLVDVATPSATHEALVRQCLPHAHVLVEKPLALSEAAARVLYRLAARHGRHLLPGHVYLHHPVVTALMDEIEGLHADEGASLHMRVHLTNPGTPPHPDTDPCLEWIHAFYLVQRVFPSALTACSAWREGDAVHASLRFAGGGHAQVVVGWLGVRRQRRIDVQAGAVRWLGELDDGVLARYCRGEVHKQLFGRAPTALSRQFEAVLDALRVPTQTPPREAGWVHRAVLQSLRLAHATREAAASPRVAAKGMQGARRPSVRSRPRVAVIGGGVFGATCALELARDSDVVLLERHPRLLTEASWLNQWRHHSGFHYPRSLETIEEVRASKAAFESVYESAIRRDVQAYYAVSAYGREISAQRYKAVCDAFSLPYTVVEPPRDILDPETVSLCLHTDECVVEMGEMERLLMRRLRAARQVDLRLATTVRSGVLLKDGRKRLKLRGPQGDGELEVDFLVNATYAGSNQVSRWFGFVQRPLRFDLLELAVLRIPDAPRFMMTILDAPFTSLTSTGEDGLFMLSHIHQSVLASEVTANGLPPRWGRLPSNIDNLIAHGRRYMPILDRAQHVSSRIGVRTVQAFSEDFDGRPTVVTPHGFGCWSVLGGKIVTAVSNAREIAAAIAREGGPPRKG